MTLTNRLPISVLDRKLLRDLWSLRGQAVAIALVIAGGVALFLVMAGMLASLAETRRAYYERYRFADIWAPVVRAPEALISDVRAMDGVAAAESRLRATALFDMPEMDEPASGEILSIPTGRAPSVNQLYLTRGRLPDPRRRNEAVMLESFAEAHGLQVRDEVSATIRGRRETLIISGFALSPEHVYSIAPGQLVPDPRLFGVMWMDRQALEGAVDLDGAFNEVVLRLARGSPEAPVIDALDRLLEPYGAPGAYGRDENISDAFVSSELDQLRTMGDLLPPIFLLVAAFLVNIVVSRLIAVEREQIGLLKAFGYSDGAVVWHYAKLVGAIALLGLVIGFALGIWLGHALAQVYIQYYHFPFLVFQSTPSVYAIAVAVSFVATGGGAFAAVRRAARLEPAVAMRAPPPPDYSRAIGAGVTRLKMLDHQTRMIVRQIVRWPVRSALTVLGIAASGALLISSVFFFDAMDRMMTVYFSVAERHDVGVMLVEPRERAAFHALARQPGVIAAEPFRAASARLRFEHREERAGIQGVIDDPQLSRMVDANERAVTPPPGGLVLSRDLADQLGAEAGDRLTVEITEGRRPVLDLPIAAVTTTLIGSGAHMRLEDLNAALGEGGVVSGARLLVDPTQMSRLYADLKAAPGVASVQLQSLAETAMREIMDQSMGTSIVVYTLFAGLIAVGVIYNAARVSLAERARELASLRVLGFSRAEVSYILLGETGLLTLIAIPLGLLMGTGLAWQLAHAMSSDLFRIPFVILPRTYGYAALILIAIAAATALIVRRRIDKFDLVAVLKARE